MLTTKTKFKFYNTYVLCILLLRKRCLRIACTTHNTEQQSSREGMITSLYDIPNKDSFTRRTSIFSKRTGCYKYSYSNALVVVMTSLVCPAVSPNAFPHNGNKIIIICIVQETITVGVISFIDYREKIHTSIVLTLSRLTNQKCVLWNAWIFHKDQQLKYYSLDIWLHSHCVITVSPYLILSFKIMY